MNIFYSVNYIYYTIKNFYTVMIISTKLIIHRVLHLITVIIYYFHSSLINYKIYLRKIKIIYKTIG